mgnify:CR=1 FL=1
MFLVIVLKRKVADEIKRRRTKRLKSRSTNFKRAMCWKYALKRQDRNPNYFDNLHQYSKNRKDKYGPQEKTNNSTSNLTCRDRRKYEEIDYSLKNWEDD